MNSLKNTARTAGFLYLIIVVTGIFGIMYVPSIVIVPGDANATASNIIQNAMLFRLGIVSNLICQATFIFLVLTLYNLFKGVNQSQARLMVALVVASVPVAFLNLLNHSVALILLSGADFLKVFDTDQLNAMVLVFLKLHTEGIAIAEVFWGLWLFPFGYLVYNSGFIPRILGILLMAACIGYLISSITHLLVPEYGKIIGPIVSIPAAIGEFAITLWFLIKGVKEQKPVMAHA